jgi:threonine/homoserine/homoserine lactone efflux protein
MFGIADYGAFCAAILLFPALQGPGTFALITALYCLLLCARAQAVSQKVRAPKRLAHAAQRVAGLFLIGFGLRLVRD